MSLGRKQKTPMLKQTELREACCHWMESLSCGREFEHADTYHFLETNFAAECDQRGDAKSEPRYKNDARWAVQDALGKTAGKKRLLRESATGDSAGCDARSDILWERSFLKSTEGPGSQNIAATPNLPLWARFRSPKFHGFCPSFAVPELLHEHGITKLVGSIGMLLQDLVHFGQRSLIHKCA